MLYEDFLLEIGCEELPAHTLQALSQALKEGLLLGLSEKGLKHGVAAAYATPRRLAVLIEKIETQAAVQKIERKGPLLSLAVDAEGQVNASGLGFARSCGVDFSELTQIQTPKGPCLYYSAEVKGPTAAECLPELCLAAIQKLPIPKPMRWGESEVSFVRPVHWVVLLLGREVLPALILEQKTDRLTYGHRFHHPEAIVLAEPKDYVLALQKAHVIVDFEMRQNLIATALTEIAATVQGQPIVPMDLLQEVTGIVEWPVPLLCQFDPHYLTVPHEALILAMQHHQKTFPIRDQNGHLIAYFISVSNINSRDATQVSRGNERVMNARLADAKFFFDTDRKHSLAFMAQKLNEIIFHARLGSLQNKADRIAELSKRIAQNLSENTEDAYRAGLLCKADLVSDMVGEFPELQGTMGAYYASHSHETAAVAQAIGEHYQPRFAKDSLPRSKTGAIVALADRIDTVVGIFSVGEIPSGDKDPFALRRAALGLLRIILAQKWDLDLLKLLDTAAEIYETKLKNPIATAAIFDFIMERFKYYYQEQGISAEVFNAVLARRPTQPYDFDCRVRAVQVFCQLPESLALAAAHKRVSRILGKESVQDLGKSQEALLQETAEQALWQALQAKKQAIKPLTAANDHEAALCLLADLQKPIDAFFESILVMVEDEKLRRNRLALLAELRDLFSQVADLSYL